MRVGQGNIFSRLNCLDGMRWLLIAEIVALFVSTALTMVMEVLLFVTALVCAGKLWPRIALLCRQPLVIMTLVFTGMLFLGMFYGPAPLAEKIHILGGWRRILLLPLAVLVFEEYHWKQRLAWAVIAAALVGAFVSVVHLLLGTPGAFEPGVVIHNHATQGIFFATAAFAAVIMSFSPVLSARPVLRLGLILSAVLLVLNIIFITPGRGGYLVLLVYTVVASLFLFRGWMRIALPVVVPLLILTLLAVSPVATKRITAAFHDMRDYEKAAELTDMGIRMVMWTNTLRIIQERPFFGHGLGGLKQAYRRQVEGVSGWQGTVTDDCHNQFMLTTAEFGLAGLLVFLAFLGSFFRQEVPAPYRVLGLGVLLAWCASSMFAGHFSTWAEGRFLLIWAGGQLAMPSLPEPGLAKNI